jgi:thioesterase domain-containing protein
MGGLIAYEMAQQLLAEGQEVRLLALFDTAMPGKAYRRARSEGMEDLTMFLLHIMGASRAQVERAIGVCRPAPPVEMLAQILAHAQRNGWLPESLSCEALYRWYRVYREILKAGSAYVPRMYYPGSIALFRRSEGVEPSGRTAGWDAVTGADLSVHVMPGDHFTMMHEPYVAIVAQRLERCLSETLTALEAPT